jgi:hypothetical protein
MPVIIRYIKRRRHTLSFREDDIMNKYARNR